VDSSLYQLDLADDSDSTLYKRIGQRASIRELIELMETVSSNLATNLLIARVDARRANATAHSLGADSILVLRGVEDGKAYRAGLNNTTTARDLGMLLAAIASGTAASPASCRECSRFCRGNNSMKAFRPDYPPERGSITRPGGSSRSSTMTPRWWSRRPGAAMCCDPDGRHTEERRCVRAGARSVPAGVRISIGGRKNAMKLITTIVRRALPEVKAALFRAGITGISLSRVSGHGGEHEIVSQYRGTTLVMEFHEKVKIEMVCSEPFVQSCIDAILSSARTGEVGDGKIFVQPIERVIRIRTGEQNNDALTAVNADEVQQAALRAADAE
jgi:nitrogen regulatory protein P-II 1